MSSFPRLQLQLFLFTQQTHSSPSSSIVHLQTPPPSLIVYLLLLLLKWRWRGGGSIIDSYTIVLVFFFGNLSPKMVVGFPIPHTHKICLIFSLLFLPPLRHRFSSLFVLSVSVLICISLFSSINLNSQLIYCCCYLSPSQFRCFVFTAFINACDDVEIYRELEIDRS